MYKLYVSEIENDLSKIDTLPENVSIHIKRYKVLDDFKRSLTGYLLLDKGLKEFGINDYEISFDGKPSIGNIHFNISHDNNKACVVISDNNIGIDIMMKRDIDDKVINYIRNSNEDMPTNIYNKVLLWCKKEAAIKYEASSISTKMNLIDTTRYMYDIIDEDDYIIAICYGRGN